MNKHRLIAIGVLVAAVAAAIGVGTAGGSGKQVQTGSAISGKISVISEATGPEIKNFKAVLAGFTKKYPKVKVKYNSAGRQIATILGTAVAGGNPPDIALLPQPGLLKDFAGKGALKPITFARPTIAKNWAPVWLQLGTVKGKLYGLFFKGANKSTVWYNVKSFKNAGVTAPTTWPAFLAAAKTIKASGQAPFSIGGSDGWTLTDLFENIYLRQAGGVKYDQLTDHKIKWTDPSVKDALRTMGQVLQSDLIAGGTAGALQTDFATSVSQAFTDPPKAAQVIEGDFVAGVITGSTKAKPGTDFNVYSFPSIGGSAPAVVGGGDAVVMFRDSPAARALISYFATPEAATIWAKLGGYSSPNKNVPPSAYKDPITRATATGLARAKTFRFDLSDLQPSAFGGTVGQGEFQLFQDFLKDPSDVDGIASKLEAAAAKAYG
ncbi:MAG: extracellular solute-binding protein, partial [Gaiellaceae bacterium]